MSKQVKNCAGKESFHRMNFLLQASNYTASVSYKSDTKHLAKCAAFVSSYYSNLAINIAKKSVLRIGVDVKRAICKGCRGVLIPGKTAKVRVRKKPTHHVRWTCEKCQTFRVFNTKSNYSVWSEQPDALVETLEYESK